MMKMIFCVFDFQRMSLGAVLNPRLIFRQKSSLNMVALAGALPNRGFIGRKERCIILLHRKKKTHPAHNKF